MTGSDRFPSSPPSRTRWGEGTGRGRGGAERSACRPGVVRAGAARRRGRRRVVPRGCRGGAPRVRSCGHRAGGKVDRHGVVGARPRRRIRDVPRADGRVPGVAHPRGAGAHRCVRGQSGLRTRLGGPHPHRPRPGSRAVRGDPALPAAERGLPAPLSRAARRPDLLVAPVARRQSHRTRLRTEGARGSASRIRLRISGRLLPSGTLDGSRSGRGRCRDPRAACGARRDRGCCRTVSAASLAHAEPSRNPGAERLRTRTVAGRRARRCRRAPPGTGGRASAFPWDHAVAGPQALRVVADEVLGPQGAPR